MSEDAHVTALDTEYTVRLNITLRYPSGKQEHRQGITIMGDDDMVLLSPKQALALLKWLYEQKDTLERLVQE